MLGVLKRRWKPKRSANVSRIPGSDPTSIDAEKDKPCRPSARQVHPVCEDKAHFLGYDKHVVMPELSPNDLANGSPPPYPKRASLDSNPSPTQCYPLAPNICVEAGRIQFIRQETEGVQQPPDSLPTPPTTPRACGRVTVTRGQQTEEGDESFDDAKKSLEDRIQELEIALEAVQKNELRDKQTIAKLQKQLARRESAQRDADRERRLRADSESRAKQALQEAARCKSRLKLLTTEFTRMEETVRSMLVYKKQAEQLRQEKNALTLAFENRCQQYQTTITRLNNEILTLRQQLAQVSSETNPEEILQAHAAALHRHAEESRKQYERCLDDVANQVVKALLAQKGLREEVGALNNRIHELESQNRALTSMLVHQLRGETTPPEEIVAKPPTPSEETSTAVKHYNSFNSEVLEEDNDNCDNSNETALSKFERRLSTNSEILDTRLSLEDKRRHQVLTKLWTDLKGSEVTPKKLLEALSAVDSTLWVQPQRPVSLNLHLPIVQATKYRRTRPILAQSSSKSEEETTGNESPESGNRDEGYSTMSSDVQADPTRGSGEAIPNRGLEDLKEATDETDITETRLLVTDNKDPDILYIPFNLLNLKPRNSYPPGKDMLPFQHIMRSFSDSHLCIKITTAPSPCYTFSSPISSSPSIFVLDITDKNPLRRAKATSTLWEICDDKASQISWSSTAEERLECTTWDAEYIQQWLRLDETRSALQQQHRDMLELEYDRAELEDWSLSLSNDDLREQYKRVDVLTPGQISISTLPSIQENNALELEEDSNECLWNSSSYMMDKEGRELVTLLMDNGSNGENEKPWPYAVSTMVNQQISPDNSWSSGSDCCHSHEPETCSKRSSAALSGCSDDTGELPAVGTDFTRDFYRLVKFESTKSLASTSSRSLGGALSENGDHRETTLHNVLNFIAEQQKYVASRDQKESPRPCSASDITKDFNIEGPPQHVGDVKICDSDACLNKSIDDENYVTFKQLCSEYTMNEHNLELKQNIAYADEVCLVTPLDVESENCSNMTERPVDICSSVNVEIASTEYQSGVLSETPVDESFTNSDVSTNNCTSDSVTSSVSTPETIVSKIPRRKQNSKIPLSPAKKSDSGGPETKIPKSKIPHKSNKGAKAQKQKVVEVRQNSVAQHVITSERLPQCSSGVISNIIDGPPHRAVSFHERATSKDVIDELNRMIKNGDEGQEQGEAVGSKLDQGCRATGWVHVEKDIDLTDPKVRKKDTLLARANLLDVMMASVSSDSSPTSSCGGSVASDSTEDPPDYGHLHRIHRFHRQKKANAARPELAVVRASLGSTRPTIIGRPDFFVRYGEKEMEAVASFDFLDDFSTTSSSLSESAELEEEFKPTEDRVLHLKVSQV
ncbi:uncharacterized protein LOC135136678 isoform X3 [Zophobas morio]|uniref:uncharacterized protein LOC135136678 isoform X3 n=1 Tax=Zophobas morio TaxID=2755281 RepID=UPI003082D3A2